MPRNASEKHWSGFHGFVAAVEVEKMQLSFSGDHEQKPLAASGPAAAFSDPTGKKRCTIFDND